MRNIAITAIDSTGRNNHHRWLHLFHDMDLNRRGVCTEESTIIDIKRVVHVSRRVTFRKIESFKVIIVSFNFRTFMNRKTEISENINDLLHHLSERMLRAFWKFSTRERNIDVL